MRLPHCPRGFLQHYQTFAYFLCLLFVLDVTLQIAMRDRQQRQLFARSRIFLVWDGHCFSHMKYLFEE